MSYECNDGGKITQLYSKFTVFFDINLWGPVNQSISTSEHETPKRKYGNAWPFSVSQFMFVT